MADCSCPENWFPNANRDLLRTLPHGGGISHHQSCAKYIEANAPVFNIGIDIASFKKLSGGTEAISSTNPWNKKNYDINPWPIIFDSHGVKVKIPYLPFTSDMPIFIESKITNNHGNKEYKYWTCQYKDLVRRNLPHILVALDEAMEQEKDDKIAEPAELIWP